MSMDLGHLEEPLGDLPAGAASRLIAAASDITLVLGPDGAIQAAQIQGDGPLARMSSALTGRPWVETVTPESRDKIDSLIGEAAADGQARWREVNHTLPDGGDAPVRYTALRLAEDGRMIALGRDMAGVAALHQKLMTAQLAVDREYERLRRWETRYRALFQLTTEAVLVVAAGNGRIVEANPAADRVLGALQGRLIGTAAADLFDADGAQTLRELFALLSAGGRPEESDATLASGVGPFRLFGSFHRQDGAAYYILRVSPPSRGVPTPAQASGTGAILSALPDGFVATDANGLIVEANGAFLDLVEAPTVEALRGAPLERWFDRPGVDFNVMMSSLKNHRVVKRFPAVLRAAHDATTPVEVTAVVAPHGDDALLGFVFRAVRPGSTESEGRGPLPHSPDQLTDLIGHVPLKDVVRETTDVIERLCIEAALRLTGDNRASAAQMLGLSRQGLYAKLRRYGITDIEL